MNIEADNKSAVGRSRMMKVMRSCFDILKIFACHYGKVSLALVCVVLPRTTQMCKDLQAAPVSVLVLAQLAKTVVFCIGKEFRVLYKIFGSNH